MLIVGSSAFSGLLSVTPLTLSTAVEIVPTAFAFAESVIFPVFTVNRICPVAPVWSKRSPRMSWPSCDSVPGIENESS